MRMQVNQQNIPAHPWGWPRIGLQMGGGSRPKGVQNGPNTVHIGAEMGHLRMVFTPSAPVLAMWSQEKTLENPGDSPRAESTALRTKSSLFPARLYIEFPYDDVGLNGVSFLSILT